MVQLFLKEEMNDEQKTAFDTFVSGKNIFLTGPGGSGKSFTIKHIVSWAHRNRKRIGVTATTGTAAILIGGRTVHSFLGIGLAQKPAVELVKNILQTKQLEHVYKRLQSLDILIVDEISMMNDELLDKISCFLGMIRGREGTPFGGVQVVLCGDFCQLPPIDGRYCFHSNAWKDADIKTCTLNTMMRQNCDTEFRNILEDLRWGVCSKLVLNRLQSLRNTVFKHGISPTILYAKNKEVDYVNQSKYDELVANGAVEKVYENNISTKTKTWANSLKIPETVKLCIGAQVVLTWNVDVENGLANGSRGVVTSFQKDGPVIMFANGKEQLIGKVAIKKEDDPSETVIISMYPIKYAWAGSIHSNQGQTLDAVMMDIGSSIFEYGQAYTAISRAKSLDSILIVNVKRKSFRTHPDVLAFYGVSVNNVEIC